MYTLSNENTQLQRFFQEGDFLMSSHLGLLMLLVRDVPRSNTKSQAVIE